MWQNEKNMDGNVRMSWINKQSHLPKHGNDLWDSNPNEQESAGNSQNLASIMILTPEMLGVWFWGSEAAASWGPKKVRKALWPLSWIWALLLVQKGVTWRRKLMKNCERVRSCRRPILPLYNLYTYIYIYSHIDIIMLFRCVVQLCTISIVVNHRKKIEKEYQEPATRMWKRKPFSKSMLLGHRTPAEPSSCLPTWWSQRYWNVRDIYGHLQSISTDKKHQSVWNLIRRSFTVSWSFFPLVTWFLRPLHRCLHGGSWRYPQHKHPGVAGSDTTKAGILPALWVSIFSSHPWIPLTVFFVMVQSIYWNHTFASKSYVGILERSCVSISSVPMSVFLGGSPRFSLAMVPQWQNCL